MIQTSITNDVAKKIPTMGVHDLQTPDSGDVTMLFAGGNNILENFRTPQKEKFRSSNNERFLYGMLSCRTLMRRF